MVTLTFKKNNRLVLGIKTKHGVLDIEEGLKRYPYSKKLPKSTLELINLETDGKIALLEYLKSVPFDNSLFLDENSLLFGPCVPDPQKIICIGLNYKQHATECGLDFPNEPIVFSKFSNSLSGHKNIIKLPNNGQEFDYEAELAIVIGKEAKDILVDDAFSYIYGYTIGNDLTARDFQFKSTQWLLGKSLDGFCPLGPYLVSKDHLKNPDNLNIQTTLNGEIRQNSNTSDMIFSCAEVVSYVSRFMTLQPGDVILTGTPEGVIMGKKESSKEWLKKGDKVNIEIEGLGTLTTLFN